MTLSREELDHEFSTLTPMQQLVLETLGSRYRLGHKVWTFSMNEALPKALKPLAEGGYIEVVPGVVPKTRRALLTDKGRKLMLLPDYVPPIAECTYPCGDPQCSEVCHSSHDSSRAGADHAVVCRALRYVRETSSDLLDN